MTWLRPPGPVAPGLTIGLLGGSFHPAHDGHFYVSETARKALKLDYVWWLVSPGNPLKDTSGMAPLDQRLAGARRVGRNPRIIVTDLERILHTRYTIDTILALRRRFPQLRFVWLMGSDNLQNFHRWRRWPDIAAHIPIAVVQRPGSLRAALHAAPIRRFGRARALQPPPAILILDGARNNQSATRLRALGADAPGMIVSPL